MHIKTTALEKLSKEFKHVVSKDLFSKANSSDTVRRLHITTTILKAGLVLAIVANILTIKDFLLMFGRYDGVNPIVSIIVFFLIFIDFYIAKKGYANFAALILIILLTMVSFMCSIMWGSLMHQALLLYVLVILIAGICLSSRAAFFMTILITIFLVILAFLQSFNLIPYNDSWRREIYDAEDAVAAGFTLLVMASISWLSNKEIINALNKAENSEIELKKERDSLEIKAKERTAELKKAQYEKLLQLNKFIDVGRITSALIHELANPLTIISLNLDNLKADSSNRHELETISSSFDKTLDAVKRMEGFIYSARKHISCQSNCTNFNFLDEVKSAVMYLEPKAKEQQVKIAISGNDKVSAFGDSTRFNQLISNLVNNAIDAFNLSDKKERYIEINCNQADNFAIISVKDNGHGIAECNLLKIFDPFFTTKSVDKGCGIGLSICKEIVEKDFGGKINVASKIDIGTKFTVHIPIK